MNMCLHRHATPDTVRLLGLGLVIAVLTAGCQSGQSSPRTRPESGSREQYLILAAELESTGRDNLYDAVHQLRPSWFSRVVRQRSGEASIIVYHDDRQMGDVTMLRRVSTRSVKSVRYLSPTEAQVRYGQINVGRPAILLETARDP